MIRKKMTRIVSFLVQASLRSQQDLKKKEKEQKLTHNDKKLDLAITTYQKLFQAICTYIGLVLLTLWLNTGLVGLSDAVLIALLTTTTATIVSVFHIASKWLYYVEKRLNKIEKRNNCIKAVEMTAFFLHKFC